MLKASPVFNAQLEPTADALLAFQEATGVFNGLDLLIDTNETLDPAIKFIGPAQTTCNYLTLAFGNLASAFSGGNGVSNWFRATSFQAPEGPNSEAGHASAPANRRRPGQKKLPPLQPLPEHRLAGSDRRVRGGQRAL